MVTGRYDAGLVVLSVVIAILASYAALSFASRVRSFSGATRFGWLAGGAIVMGMGIWSMHFVGMLAFSLPIPLAYAPSPMLLSAVAAIAASLLAMYVVSRDALRPVMLGASGLLMGGAIVSMHYIGMASIRGAARLHHDSLLVGASVVIAIVASFAALALAFRYRTDADAPKLGRKASSALVMGVAIAGMHYTAMAGARFALDPSAVTQDSRILATPELGFAVALGSLIILALGLAGVAMDRRVLAHRASLVERLEEQAHLLSEQAAELTTQTESLEEQAVEQEMLNDELQRANARLADALAETERARHAEQLASAARTRFVNMASHELRTPIGAIGGYAELLLMELRGPLSEGQRRDLERIRFNQQHLLKLVNEMLDLAKLEAGQMPVHLDQVALPKVLEATVPMIEPQLMAKHIRYSQEFESPAPLVIGDAERLQQILINLLANSVKYTPASGSISVSTVRKDSQIELRVHDSGPGIPLPKRDGLFRPFAQLDGGEHGGTGLGLAISRELARAMGGNLELDCDDCEGATFVLSLRASSDGKVETMHPA